MALKTNEALGRLGSAQGLNLNSVTLDGGEQTRP